jgi:membrane-associated phospholipid phosphatase
MFLLDKMIIFNGLSNFIATASVVPIRYSVLRSLSFITDFGYYSCCMKLLKYVFAGIKEACNIRIFLNCCCAFLGWLYLYNNASLARWINFGKLFSTVYVIINHYMVSADARTSSVSNTNVVFADKVLYSMHIVFIRREDVLSYSFRSAITLPAPVLLYFLCVVVG